MKSFMERDRQRGLGDHLGRHPHDRGGNTRLDKVYSSDCRE